MDRTGEFCTQHDKVQFQVTSLYTMVDDLAVRVGKLEADQSTSATSTAVTSTQLTGIKDILGRIEASIAKEFSLLYTRLDTLDKRVKDLEDTPRNFWNSIAVGAISAVASGIIVWLITRG